MRLKNRMILPGEMAEWSIAAVLKTVEGHTSGGSNPSLSATNPDNTGHKVDNSLQIISLQAIFFIRKLHIKTSKGQKRAVKGY